MIDFSKLGIENYWDSYGAAPRQPTQPAYQGQQKTSITRPPTDYTATINPVGTVPLTTAATPATTTGGTPMTQTYAPFTNYPSQWQTASNTLTGIAQGGNPVNYGGWYNQAKQTAQTDITDAIRQAVEQAGMGGMRWSSALGRTGQDIAGRTMADLARDWTGMELGAQQQGIQNQLGAAQGLMGLGGQYAQLPMDVAGNMMNMGGAMQNAYNQQISPFYNLWNSQQAYNSPWLSPILQMAQSAQPQTYQKSGFGNILDALLGVGGAWLMGGGGNPFKG